MKEQLCSFLFSVLLGIGSNGNEMLQRLFQSLSVFTRRVCHSASSFGDDCIRQFDHRDHRHTSHLDRPDQRSNGRLEPGELRSMLFDTHSRLSDVCPRLFSILLPIHLHHGRCVGLLFATISFFQTAISGKWFCPSAFTAARLLLSNCLRIFVLDRVCAVLLHIGRVTITVVEWTEAKGNVLFFQIGSCVFTAYLLDRESTSVTLHFSWFPVLIIGIVVYISSAIFLNVYSTATSTLFFCVLYDLEVHQSSAMESQVMSNRLKNILSESNDFPRKTFPVERRSSTNAQTQSRF